MTEDEFDIHEPYRCYVFMFLLFDCQRCGRTFDGEPVLPAEPDWQWYHDTAEQALQRGWYVAPALPNGTQPLYCLCPACAAKKGYFTAPNPQHNA